MNPEAVRFAPEMSSAILYLVCLAADILAIAAVAVLESSGTSRWLDPALIAALVLLQLFSVPGEVVTDQFGIHSRGRLLRRSVHIRWKDVGRVESGVEVPLFGSTAFGLRNDTIVVYSHDGERRVIHTSRHPDSIRLLLEIRQHGVSIESELTV